MKTVGLWSLAVLLSILLSVFVASSAQAWSPTSASVRVPPSALLTSSVDASGVCGGITCSSHGICVVKGGEPVCACYEGYFPDERSGINCLPVTTSNQNPDSMSAKSSSEDDANVEHAPSVNFATSTPGDSDSVVTEVAVQEEQPAGVDGTTGDSSVETDSAIMEGLETGSVSQLNSQSMVSVFVKPLKSKHAYSLSIVAADGKEYECRTPCNLELPYGPAKVAVTGGAKFDESIVIPSASSEITIQHRNRGLCGVVTTMAWLFIGGMLAGIVVGGVTDDWVLASQTGFIPGGAALGIGLPFSFAMGKNKVSVSYVNARPNN